MKKPVKDKIDPVKYLAQADPVLGQLIQKIKRPKWKLETDYLRNLVETIINQQLSDKAANTIIGRFNMLFRKLPYTPEDILLFSDDAIRRVGISYGKVSFIKDLAKKTQTQTLDFANIHQYSDAEVVDHLIQVKGIGKWTTEMFLMFSLGREDIFSFGDAGLRAAIEKLYPVRKPLPLETAKKISDKWRPYRSWACRYLWASLDLKS